MSHFNVLIIGENPESKLAPYHEFECTGRDDEYVVDVDITEEAFTAYAERSAPGLPENIMDYLTDYYALEPVEEGEEPDRDGRHKFGYIVVDKGEVKKVVDRTNVDKYLVTVCPGCDTNHTNHGKGSHAPHATRNEILPQLQDDQKAGRVPPSSQEQGREVHVLQALHENAERSQDTRNATDVAPEAAVRLDSAAGRRDVAATAGGVCDLRTSLHRDPSGAGSAGGQSKITSNSGPLPQNWKDTSAALHELQQRARQHGGQCRTAPCSSELPHLPHETHRALISGSKWDWYELGGRWTGFFQLKSTVSGPAAVGRPGLMTGPAPAGRVDQALKRDIDFESMREAASSDAATYFDSVVSALGDLVHSVDEWSWAAVKARHTRRGRLDIDAARAAYNYCDAVRTLEEAEIRIPWSSTIEEALCGFDREAYLALSRARAVTTHAVITADGQWHEIGQMGWFGTSHDEMTEEVWCRQVSDLLDSVSGDTMLSLYDCHI